MFICISEMEDFFMFEMNPREQQQKYVSWFTGIVAFFICV